MRARDRTTATVLALGALLGIAAAPVAAHEPRTAADGPIGLRTPRALPAQMNPEPPERAAPRPERCGPGSQPEPGMQGRVAKEDVDAGRAKGYRCNMSVIGRSGSTGGFRVHRYVDKQGNECAYYDTTLLFPTNATSLSLEPTGVAVLDMSDPARPVRTDTLVTPAMQTPHESVNISVQGGILAAVLGNPAQYPGGIDVYDISEDCRHPVPMAAAFPATPFGHESGMAPDGRTFYPTSIGTGHTTAVDITNPRLPRPVWMGEFNTHGMSVSDDGNRGYLAASEGLIILDLSEVQARKPDPQVREISRLTWSNMTIPQVPIPVTIDGRPYVVEVDEYSASPDGEFQAHGDRVGAARIIDVSDETKPFVVSNIRLGVHQKENRAAIGGDYGAQSPVQGYAAHYCNVPQRQEPGIVACSMIASGLRVFDIRDPANPKEIAYHVAPPDTISASGSDFIDERSNWAMSQPAFAPERGEIWYSDGTSGFYALKVDEDVWPFTGRPGAPTGTRGGRGACLGTRGLADVSARPVRGGLRIGFRRRAKLPVQVDVFRVSQGRRVIRERLIARFRNRRKGFTWRGRGGRGLYFVRVRMTKRGKAFDTHRVVVQRSAAGRFRARPSHYRKDLCSLLGKVKLERPAFGGPRRVPLRGAYRLSARGRVTITVRRGGRVVKRIAATRPGHRTFRFAIAARSLPRGEYRVVVHATSGESQGVTTLTARRL